VPVRIEPRSGFSHKLKNFFFGRGQFLEIRLMRNSEFQKPTPKEAQQSQQIRELV
jgi:hypothetical protein